MFASVNAYGPAINRPVTLENGRATGPFQTGSVDLEARSDGRPTGRPGESSFDNRVQPGEKSEKSNNDKKPSETAQSEGPPRGGEEELSDSEERQVQELKQRDQEVRAHEQAHATVGGSYASPPSYEYTVGPDGKRYATSGEVKIDASPVRDNPKATVRKMEVVIRAALAPAEPSSQDLQVARQAQETRAKAQAELTKQQDAEHSGGDGEGAVGAPGPIAQYASQAYSDASSQVTEAIQAASLGALFSQAA